MKKEITVITHLNPKGEKVTAEIYHDNFAVHKKLNNAKGWALTQIPTGYVICHCKYKKDCISCLTELYDNFDFTFKTIEQWHAIMKDKSLINSMLSVIKKYRI